MPLRLCPKTFPPGPNSLCSRTRQFNSIIKRPYPLVRTNAVPIQQHLKQSSLTPFVFRRNLFSMRKQTTDTATKAAKTAFQIAVRFTMYSSVFVIFTVAGFFIYDVGPSSLIRP